MSYEPMYVAKTLAWCNARRKTQGMKPLKRLPKGNRQDPESCPCGKATGLYVGDRMYGPSFERRHYRHLPAPVRSFIQHFDNGWLPQYEVKP